MKKEFFDMLIKLMGQNTDIFFVSAGLGWPRTDEIAEKYPDRYIQTEASEQTALDICVGLAYSGKIPIVYTITPFFYRCFESIRNFLDHENLGIILIGAGRDDDYSKDDGFSHYAGDDKKFLGAFDNLECYWPKDIDEMKSTLQLATDQKEVCAPTYINLTR